MSETNPVAAAYCLFCILIFAVCYLGGKKRFLPRIAPLDKEEFGLKDFFPAGYFLMWKLKYKYNTPLDRTLRRQLKELYDPEFTDFYLQTYWAASATYVLIGFFLSGLLALSGQYSLSAGAVGFGFVLGYIGLTDLKSKIEKRHQKISMDMPDLTNKIVILSGAGMTLRAAIEKISSELSNDRPLYEELSYAVRMMGTGATPEEAFDRFMMRCNMPQVRRFVSVILQNMHRGGNDVILALSEIGAEQWEERKNAARKFGEEASTKMLFPMMLMLLAVIMLTVAPAVMSMNL